MYFLKPIILFLFFSVVFSTEHVFRVRDCPPVKVMKDFDVNKFLGDWYVVQRFYPKSSCVKIRIEKSPEGEFTVAETNRLRGRRTLDLMNRHFQRNEREIKFVSNKTDAIFKVDRGFGSLALRTFGVVDTDYESFAMVWGCDPLLIGSIQNFDVLSRSPEENEVLMQYAKDKLKEMDISFRPLRPVSQKYCGEETTENKVNNMFVDF